MKIRILFILLFAFIVSTDCNAKSKHPDEILESVIHNNVEYKVIKTWWKNSKGSYNPALKVLANDQLIHYNKFGWSGWTKLIEIEGHLLIREKGAGDSQHIYDSHGNKIQSNYEYPDFAGIGKFADIEKPLICFSRKYGIEEKEFFSLDGNLLIPSHEYVKTYSKGQKKFYHISDYKTEGLMDEDLNFIFPVKEHQKIEYVEDSPFFICKNSTTTIFNCSNSEILPYSFIKRINGSYFYIVGDNRLYGVYNSEQNTEIFPLHYEQIHPINGKDWVMVNKSGMCGIMSLYGKEVIPAIYKTIQFGESNFAIVEKNSRFGVYNMQSNSEIISPDFDGIEIIDENLIKYKLNGFWGVMTLNGREIIPTTRGYTDINYIKGLKKYTYSMHGFKGECNSLGRQISKIAVPVNNSPSHSSKSSNSSSSSGNSGNSATNVQSNNGPSNNTQGQQVQPYTETVPVQVWQPCGGCNGSGQCQVCYGSGWILGYNGDKRLCTACHGSGKCTSCAGHGGQNVVRYEQRTVYR